ncbi:MULTISPECIES: MarR family winged helix-turn-helix transcriptional regulator [unclassified Geobacillus]|uniref:MarR family winged helix-turn-helix transcriptional regulator n=1 Tax=unclassified Geobacillus TaxID=2642459 RepID=UPI00018C14FF|nr:MULTISPECIES: MarR family transcriptional regulator [unclassified Geobacillus]ADI27551.1 transcriptional regulator, MarR family [Geobacillus sp. C56-T3]ADU93352.1 transcriptional regulator, MarR family [Geobacillus sp. Y412MC52]ALA71230.1 transcriptional regulator [Geobacillus stearothermophilus 10]KDE48553.1 transcriptional regulator [Geobacillus sp. CAMR12739]
MEQKEQALQQSLKLFIVLSRAYRSVSDQVNKSIQSFGVNPTEFAVLELLYHKGDQPLQQIGEKILLASGSITYVIDKLENKGLIIRRACERDRRVTYASITDSGRQFIQRVFPEHAETIHETVAALTPEEKEQAIVLLKKLGYGAKSRD